MLTDRGKQTRLQNYSVLPICSAFLENALM